MADSRNKIVKSPVSKPEYDVKVKDIRVPMRDGVRLYAKGWFPDGKEIFPVVINYDPYRSSDFRTLARGNFFHFLARHGYIVFHLGARGTDGSEGIVTDEYPLQEQLDGYDAIEWIAAQDWNNSNIGMIGTSYAGFTAIQVAMHRPPRLKAIIPLYATDDRYTDDVHYSGGALDAIYDVTNWATMMVSLNALPPPETIGEDFEEIWQAHLDGNIPYQLNWLENQTDGPYWRPASLHPNFDKIQCAVFNVGAWYDWYRNSAVRMYKHLEVPNKLLMGPWEHVFPDWGSPGAPINFMPQAVRFLDHWLKGIDTGMMEEPTLTTFMRSATDPPLEEVDSSGYWREENSWPETTDLTLFLGVHNRLSRTTADSGSDDYHYIPSVGIGFPTWTNRWTAGSDDDRAFDLKHSLVYNLDPSEETIEILGRPVLDLVFSSTAPVVNMIAKLFDVSPDGTLDQFTFGVLNLTHRDSHTDPSPLNPGTLVKVKFELDVTSWILKKGHALKLVIAASSFPHVWPSPYPANNTIFWGEDHPSSLTIPTVSPSDVDLHLDFGEIQMPLDTYTMNHSPIETEIERVGNAITFNWKASHSGKLDEEGVEFIFDETSRFTVSDDEPGNAVAESTQVISRKTPNNFSEASAYAKLESTTKEFMLSYELEVTLNGSEKAKRSWNKTYPRNLV